MTQTANCARHLGVIVEKMQPKPPPQIHTPVANKLITLLLLSPSNPDHSHLVKDIFFSEFGQNCILYKIKVNLNRFLQIYLQCPSR